RRGRRRLLAGAHRQAADLGSGPGRLGVPELGSRGEYEPNVAGVSAAVMDSDTGQIFGIGVALPAPELHDDNEARFGRAVRDAALRVGKRIGDPYWLRYVETGTRR
ncbi:hypothetical protein ABZ638_35920, partial [Streptomyces sp. NPDC007107]